MPVNPAGAPQPHPSLVIVPARALPAAPVPSQNHLPDANPDLSGSTAQRIASGNAVLEATQQLKHAPELTSPFTRRVGARPALTPTPSDLSHAMNGLGRHVNRLV